MFPRQLVLVTLSAGLLLGSADRSTAIVDVTSPDQPSSEEDAGVLSPEVQISSTDLAYGQERPSSAYNPNHDEYMVVWYNARPFTQDITVRRVSSMGELLSQFFVSTGDNCVHPDLAYNITDDEYLVVWSQSEFHVTAPVDEYRWEIWGRIIEWNAPGSNSPFLIASWDGLNLEYPRVAYNTNRNEYMVVWQTSQVSGGALTGIGRRRISNTGAFPSSAAYLTGSGTINQGAPDIDYSVTGDNYLVAWVEPGPVAQPNIYVGLLNYLGTVPTAKHQLEPTYQAYDQQRPAVAANNNDGFMVVFNIFPPPDMDIYGREVKTDGTIVNTTYLVAIDADIDEQNPAISRGPSSKEYFIVYEYETLAGMAIKAIRWGNDVSFRKIVLAEPGMGDNTYPTVATGRPGMLAAYEWVSFTPGDDKAIYGRVYWPEVNFLPLVTR